MHSKVFTVIFHVHQKLQKKYRTVGYKKVKTPSEKPLSHKGGWSPY